MYSFEKDLDECGQTLQFVVSEHLKINSLILVGNNLSCLKVFFSLLVRPLSVRWHEDLAGFIMNAEKSVGSTCCSDLIIIEASHNSDLDDFEKIAKTLSAYTKNVLCLFDWASADSRLGTNKFQQCLFSFRSENFHFDEEFRMALWSYGNLSPELKTNSLMFRLGTVSDLEISSKHYPVVDVLHPALLKTGETGEIDPLVADALQRLKEIEESFTWQFVLRIHSFLERRPRLKDFLRKTLAFYFFRRN